MSGGSKSSTQKTEPWAGQQPYLRDLFKQAKKIYRKGYGQEYYPGQTVAPFSPYTEQGLQSMGQFGAMQSPQQMAMGNWLNQSMSNPYGMAGLGMDYVGGGQFVPGGGFGESTLPGGQPPTPYFSGNPHLDQMFNTVAQRSGEQFAEQTMPEIASMFGGAGRTGSGIQQEIVGQAVDDFNQNLMQQAGDIYGRAYETGMDRDLARRQLGADIGMQGAAMAPTYQQMQMNQIDQMMRAGALTEDQAQRLMDAQKAQFDFYQQAPWQALGQYGNIIQGMPGGYGTTTGTPARGSRLQGAAGGAAAGSTFGPWGTAIGAGLGYLAS